MLKAISNSKLITGINGIANHSNAFLTRIDIATPETTFPYKRRHNDNGNVNSLMIFIGKYQKSYERS